MTIKRYDCTNGGYQYCAGCYQMEQSEYGDYIRVEDVREKLRQLREFIYDNVNDSRDGRVVNAELDKLIEELK